MREIIQLECTQCKRRNYTSTKNKRKHPEKQQVKKYCPHCKMYTIHKEVK